MASALETIYSTRSGISGHTPCRGQDRERWGGKEILEILEMLSASFTSPISNFLGFALNGVQYRGLEYSDTVRKLHLTQILHRFQGENSAFYTVMLKISTDFTDFFHSVLVLFDLIRSKIGDSEAEIQCWE